MTSILVIHDEEPIRILLRKTLEQAGYAVQEAKTGKDGLCQVRQTAPALVITDLLMPDADGIEVIMALHREAPTVPIIAFSGGTGGLDCLEPARLLGANRTMRNLSRCRNCSKPCRRSCGEDRYLVDQNHRESGGRHE